MRPFWRKLIYHGRLQLNLRSCWFVGRSSFMIKIIKTYYLKLICLCRSMPFYAVKVGRVPGVFNEWGECKKSVDGFNGAIYKKFATIEEATEFVHGSSIRTISPSSGSDLKQQMQQPAVPQKTCTCVCSCGAFPGMSLSVVHQLQSIVQDLPAKRNLDEIDLPSSKKVKFSKNVLWQPIKEEDALQQPINEEDVAVVYTDGACAENGRKGAKGGIGVYWGPNHPLNVSEPLEGRQTNNRAEIMAAARALNQCKSMSIRKVKLYTDSNFLIKGITQWINKWKRNGWKLSTGGDVINKEDFEILDEARMGLQVQWIHVRGHHGIAGNEAADRLARDAIG